MPYVETEAYYDNTIMREIRNNDNILIAYDISPVDGYVLHNSSLDVYEVDMVETDGAEEEDVEPTITRTLISRGYSHNSCSVFASYDFNINPDEIYAIKEDAVGEDGVIF